MFQYSFNMNYFTPRVKPWLMDRTLKCDYSLESSTVVLFAVQFYPVCNFDTFINFGLGTVRTERVGALPRTFTWIFFLSQLIPIKILLMAARSMHSENVFFLYLTKICLGGNFLCFQMWVASREAFLKKSVQILWIPINQNVLFLWERQNTNS